jgi:hypothetical protein
LVGLVVAVIAGPTVAGCAGQGAVEQDAAASAALRFENLAATDPAGACALLAPRTLEELERDDGPCRQALPALQLPAPGAVVGAQVFGKDAVVHLHGDTVFLARHRGGWRVTAAGCTPDGDGPYECRVEGG